MANGLIVSTENVPLQDSAGAWCDWIDRLFGGLGSDLYGDATFDGRMATYYAGDVVLTQLEANRHRVIRSGRMARTCDVDHLKIVAPWHGSAIVEQDGRQACVRPGGWAIYDTTSGYQVENPERCRHLIVMLPKSQLQQAGLRLDALTGRQVGGGHGISRVALETMRNVYGELPVMTPAAAHGAGQLILELVRLSLQELAGQHSATTQQAAFRDRIRDYVGLHLRDPELSIERIASALNCSKRHLHNAFADEDDTLANHILRRRLQATLRELRVSEPPLRTVTEIALSWGFASVAHFSRVFREHTGMSPTEFREASLRCGNPCNSGGLPDEVNCAVCRQRLARRVKGEAEQILHL
ncbi:MAG: helix-turn-helix domain-containing protein [Rhodocyclaceae bacterium]